MVRMLYWFTAILLLSTATGTVRGGNVTYDGRSLIINGQHKILFSGSIHYPRSTPDVRISLSVHELTMHLFLFFFFLVCFAYSSSTSMAFIYFFVALHSSISHLYRKSRTLHLISSLPFSHGCVSLKKR